MTPTLVDIAKETNTSVSTVSRVLAGGEVAQRISAETRQRVLEAASRMGYRPNLLARSLRTRKSYSVALVLPDISSWQFASIARQVEQALHKHGYSLTLCNSGGDAALEREYLDMLPRKGIDGLILVPHAGISERISQLVSDRLPLVLLDCEVPGVNACVSTNQTQGANLLAKTMDHSGIKRIVLISGPQTVKMHRIRSEAMKEHFTIVAHHEGPDVLETARRAATNAPGAVDAVVCTGRCLAEGYLASVDKLDPALVMASFDSSPLLRALPVPVISCDPDAAALADGCTKLLMPQLRGESANLEPIVVPMKLLANRAFEGYRARS